MERGTERQLSSATGFVDQGAMAMAATLPRMLREARKLIELHLAEYRRQTQSLVTDFSNVVNKKHGELKGIILQHAEIVKRDSSNASSRLADVNEAARIIQKNLYTAVKEWNYAQESFAQERHKLRRSASS